MAKKDFYTVYEHPDHWLVQKMDPDDHAPVTNVDNPGVMPAYKVRKTNDKLSACDCWAGQKWCRHKQIIVIFQQHQRVGKGWLYNFDKKKWIEPIAAVNPEEA